MLTNSDLFDILMMRSAPAYHAAEVLRRQIGGSDLMALSPPSSEAHAAVRLLIGTWETISLRVLAGGPLLVQFYQDNPVGHMWLQLEPGIKILRGETFKNKNVGWFYAREFQKRSKTYGNWLRTQEPASYRTAALEGINAQFG